MAKSIVYPSTYIWSYDTHSCIDDVIFFHLRNSSVWYMKHFLCTKGFFFNFWDPIWSISKQWTLNCVHWSNLALCAWKIQTNVKTSAHSICCTYFELKSWLDVVEKIIGRTITADPKLQICRWPSLGVSVSPKLSISVTKSGKEKYYIRDQGLNVKVQISSWQIFFIFLYHVMDKVYWW